MGKLQHLDGLRGYAAMIVTFVHILGFTPYNGYVNSLKDIPEKHLLYRFLLILMTGSIPVNIFFQLSGRVIALSFIKSSFESNSTTSGIPPKFRKLASAFIRRPFRLVIPAVFASFFMWVSVVTNQFSFHDLANQYIPSWWKSDWYKPPNDVALNPDLWTHLSRAVGTVLFSQKNPPYFIPVQWTLYHEYLDSYCIFILAAIGSMIPPTQRIMFYVSTYLLTHIFEINYLPDFIFGLMIAELGEFGVFEKFTKSKTSISKIIPAVAFFMCPISFIFIDNFTNKEQLQAHFAVTFLIVAVEISPTLQYLLSRPFSVFLGHVSFGVYLLHPILMHSVCPMLVPFVVGKKYLKGANISWIVYLETLMMMMMVFSYFGWIFYKTVDLWSVKVGRVVESFFFDDKFDIKKPSLSLSENLESSRKWCLEMLLFWWDVLVWCWIRWMISVLLDMSLLGVKFFGWIKGLETSGQYVKVNSNED